MSSVTLSRASGLALLLGLLLVLIGIVLRVLDPGINPTQEASALFVCSNVLVFSGIALLLFGWLGLVARLARLAGWLGLAGAFLLFLSGVLFASIAAYNFLASPWYAVHAPNAAAQVLPGTPAVQAAAIVASWLLLGGAVLAELAMMRARLLSAWAGLLIVVAGVLGLVFDFVLFNLIVFLVALLLFVLGLGWMAYALLSAKEEALRPPVPTP
jgi:drug/metabolite transporter (DMT)-like permease